MKTAHDRDWAFFAGGAVMDYAGHPTQGLALAEGVLRKIFRDNAVRWLPGLGRAPGRAIAPSAATGQRL